MMRVSTRVLLAGACLLGACAHRTPEEQGRTYTRWLVEGDFASLWARFSPEMKQTFPSPASLASFAGQAADKLGTAPGPSSEQLSRDDSLTVYSRQLTYAGGGRRMLLQWTMMPDGTVTGFVLRSARDSLGPG
jgi:hypothetical protein